VFFFFLVFFVFLNHEAWKLGFSDEAEWPNSNYGDWPQVHGVDGIKEAIQDYRSRQINEGPNCAISQSE